MSGDGPSLVRQLIETERRLAAAEAERDRLAEQRQALHDVLSIVVGYFTVRGHPGVEALRTPWLGVATVQALRDTLAANR